jgi:hypothetical protein
MLLLRIKLKLVTVLACKTQHARINFWKMFLGYSNTDLCTLVKWSVWQCFNVWGTELCGVNMRRRSLYSIIGFKNKVYYNTKFIHGKTIFSSIKILLISLEHYLQTILCVCYSELENFCRKIRSKWWNVESLVRARFFKDTFCDCQLMVWLLKVVVFINKT